MADQRARDEHRRALISTIISAQQLGVDRDDLRHELAEALLGRPVPSWNVLTIQELRRLRTAYQAYPLILHQRRELPK